MSGVLTNKNQIVRFPLLLVLAIAIATIALLTIVPFITAPEVPVIPVTGGQNAYSEYLRGEKILFGMPADAGGALSAYHVGEKTFYAGVASPSEALALFHFGETHVMSPAEYALLIYRAGEKEVR